MQIPNRNDDGKEENADEEVLEVEESSGERRQAPAERTLFLNGTIAEESWFDDDVTPAAF